MAIMERCTLLISTKLVRSYMCPFDLVCAFLIPVKSHYLQIYISHSMWHDPNLPFLFFILGGLFLWNVIFKILPPLSAIVPYESMKKWMIKSYIPGLQLPRTQRPCIFLDTVLVSELSKSPIHKNWNSLSL